MLQGFHINIIHYTLQWNSLIHSFIHSFFLFILFSRFLRSPSSSSFFAFLLTTLSPFLLLLLLLLLFLLVLLLLLLLLLLLPLSLPPSLPSLITSISDGRRGADLALAALGGTSNRELFGNNVDGAFFEEVVVTEADLGDVGGLDEVVSVVEGCRLVSVLLVTRLLKDDALNAILYLQT